MNKDLIIKLVKLANNNPNDNEANNAARKVCKLLEEGNFENGWVTSRRNTQQPNPNQPNQSQTSGWNPFNNWDFDYVYQNMKQAQERAVKQERERENQRRENEQRENEQRERYKEKHEYVYDPSRTVWVNVRTGKTLSNLEYQMKQW